MRIFQINHGLAYGGAIGNYMIQIDHMLKKHNIETGIYVHSCDKRYPIGTTKDVYSLEKIIQPDDIVLYHMCHQTPLNHLVTRLNCRKIMLFHNITPPEFFEDYNLDEARKMKDAYRELREMSPYFDLCLCMSKYNAKCLSDYGYPKSKIGILTGCIIPFDMYEKEPDEVILEKYKDSYTNILFVGRVAPNKKQEDVIRQFAYYQKHLNANSRLFLVGAFTYTQYVDALKEYVAQIGVHNVIFTGHISTEELISYYRISDIFLCMSEHEGFCVPLVEAMYFNLPIIAYRSTAIPDTLSEAGIILDTKDSCTVSMWIDRIIHNDILRSHLIACDKERLKNFSLSNMEDELLKEIYLIQENGEQIL